MTNKLERSSRYTGHYPTSLGLSCSFSATTTFFLNPNYINLENVASADDKVGNRAHSLGRRRQVGVEIVGLNRTNLRRKVGTGMRYESRSAVLYTRRQVHHLEGRVAHLAVENSIAMWVEREGTRVLEKL